MATDDDDREARRQRRRGAQMGNIIRICNAFKFDRATRLEIVNKTLWKRGGPVPEAESLKDLSDEELDTMVAAFECAAFVAHLWMERNNTLKNRKHT